MYICGVCLCYFVCLCEYMPQVNRCLRKPKCMSEPLQLELEAFVVFPVLGSSSPGNWMQVFFQKKGKCSEPIWQLSGPKNYIFKICLKLMPEIKFFIGICFIIGDILLMPPLLEIRKSVCMLSYSYELATMISILPTAFIWPRCLLWLFHY